MRKLIRETCLVDSFELKNGNNTRLKSKDKVLRGQTYFVIRKNEQVLSEATVYFCKVYWSGSKPQLKEEFSAKFQEKHGKTFDLSTFKIELVKKSDDKNKKLFIVKFTINCERAKILLLNSFLWISHKKCFIKNKE